MFVTSGAATNTRAYRGPYSVSKAALNALARTYAAETVTTNVRVNLFNPGPTRTRMRAAAMPGEDPMTLKTAETVAEQIVAMCLPDFQETGKLYDCEQGRLLDRAAAGADRLFPVQEFQDRLAHDRACGRRPTGNRAPPRSAPHTSGKDICRAGA